MRRFGSLWPKSGSKVLSPVDASERLWRSRNGAGRVKVESTLLER